MDRKVLIVEDEPLIAKDLSYILNDIGIAGVKIAMSYDDALLELSQESFDLALLDINLSSEQDGVDLAKVINRDYKIPFIFITSYYNESVVSRAKVTEPLAYLLKPFNEMDIRINVEMALYKAKVSQTQDRLFLREKTGAIHVDPNEIIFLEAQDNYTRLVLRDQEILASQTLKSMIEKLSSDEFIRTHKSFAVRLKAITMIKGGYIYLGSQKVPVGRSYKSEFQERISLI